MDSPEGPTLPERKQTEGSKVPPRPNPKIMKGIRPRPVIPPVVPPAPPPEVTLPPQTSEVRATSDVPLPLVPLQESWRKKDVLNKDRDILKLLRMTPEERAALGIELFAYGQKTESGELDLSTPLSNYEVCASFPAKDGRGYISSYRFGLGKVVLSRDREFLGALDTVDTLVKDSAAEVREEQESDKYIRLRRMLEAVTETMWRSLGLTPNQAKRAPWRVLNDCLESAQKLKEVMTEREVPLEDSGLLIVDNNERGLNIGLKVLVDNSKVNRLEDAAIQYTGDDIAPRNEVVQVSLLREDTIKEIRDSGPARDTVLDIFAKVGKPHPGPQRVGFNQ